VAVVGHGLIDRALVENQLHRFDSTVEVSVEIASDGGVRDLVVLCLSRVVTFLEQDSVLQDALLGEELPDKVVPVLQVVSGFGSLQE
jgi:hypothetical protein